MTLEMEAESTVRTESEPHEGDLVTRVTLESNDLSSSEFSRLWTDQDKYIDMLEARLRLLEEKGRGETSRREQLLVMRLTSKEQELQEMAAQIAELKAAQAPSAAQLRQTLLDPAVNLIIQKLTKECEQLKKAAEEAQNELAAWKFTPDSATGKRLMAKCRQLYQENEDLGKMIASGRLAKLEGELALQKNLTDEMKKNQLEMDEFMAELDEDVEGMQSTIYYLQQQLREAKETITKLEAQLGDNEADDKDSKKKVEIISKPVNEELSDKKNDSEDEENDQAMSEKQTEASPARRGRGRGRGTRTDPDGKKI